MEQEMEALDLSIGIKSQKNFFNLGCLDAKTRKAKEEDIMQDFKEQPIEEEVYIPAGNSFIKKVSE
jgi:hypothetical protein